mmetsp:Transcript_43902/g.93974  ORF Transcript_43902/g.93974 Transcript_43902/m.93974 type:complete len:135 (+) Transcript_43902:488-892(+)
MSQSLAGLASSQSVTWSCGHHGPARARIDLCFLRQCAALTPPGLCPSFYASQANFGHKSATALLDLRYIGWPGHVFYASSTPLSSPSSLLSSVPPTSSIVPPLADLFLSSSSSSSSCIVAAGALFIDDIVVGRQ